MPKTQKRFGSPHVIQKLCKTSLRLLKFWLVARELSAGPNRAARREHKVRLSMQIGEEIQNWRKGPQSAPFYDLRSRQGSEYNMLNCILHRFSLFRKQSPFQRRWICSSGSNRILASPDTARGSSREIVCDLAASLPPNSWNVDAHVNLQDDVTPVSDRSASGRINQTHEEKKTLYSIFMKSNQMKWNWKNASAADFHQMIHMSGLALKYNQ